MESNTLNKLHKIEVEILDEIVRLCTKYNLRYYLIGGTLLGAIRHKGFIPWDDDLDIAMPRGDYQKFIILAQSELSSDFYLHSTETDNDYWLPFAKVKKRNTIFDDATALWLKDKNGIWVDVFPLDMDNLNNMKSIRKKFNRHAIYRLMITDKLRNKKNWKWWVKYFILGFPSIKTMNKRIFKIITAPVKCLPDAYVNYGSQYGYKKQTMPISWYEPTIDVEFEGKKYTAPGNYNEILKRLYGDYMKLPPIEKRVTHNPVRLSFDTNGNDEILA